MRPHVGVKITWVQTVDISGTSKSSGLYWIPVCEIGFVYLLYFYYCINCVKCSSYFMRDYVCILPYDWKIP